MTYQIKITSQANQDLKDIFEYIAYELQEYHTAICQLDRLEKEINSLSQMPERYRIYDREPWRSRNFRIMPVDNYLVFYIPDSNTQTVFIVRVFYGRRAVDAQLQE